MVSTIGDFASFRSTSFCANYRTAGSLSSDGATAGRVAKGVGNFPGHRVQSMSLAQFNRIRPEALVPAFGLAVS